MQHPYKSLWVLNGKCPTNRNLQFQILLCLCCCCSKKRNVDEFEPVKKSKVNKSSPYPDNGYPVENLIVTRPTNSNSNDGQPPNYQSIRRDYNFGGTADLYQNVTPPSYNSAVDQPQYKINTHVSKSKLSSGKLLFSFYHEWTAIICFQSYL